MAEVQTGLGVGTILKAVLGEPATYDVAGFGALSLVEIVDVVNIGAGGGTASVQSYTPLKTGKEVRVAGAIQYQDRAINMGTHLTNAGHVILSSGFDGVNQGKMHSFGIFYPDGTVYYTTGTISGYTSEQLEANTFIFNTVTFTPNREPVIQAGADVFTVTYAAGANGSIIGDAAQMIESGEDATTVFANAADLYEFDQWSDASTDNPRTDTNVTANIAVTASFTLI